MKKGIAITLLVLHLFNFAGYNLVFQYFINKSEATLLRQLDNDKYNEQDLMVLKVALNLPYYNASGTAERVDGEIELSGTHYNYVKRAVRNDTLYLYCIPNTEKTKLAQAQTAYSKQAGDAQPDNQKGGNSLLKKMKWGGDYNMGFLKSSGAVSITVSTSKAQFLLHKWTAPLSPVPYKPPETA